MSLICWKPFRVPHNLKDKDQNPQSSREIPVSPGTRWPFSFISCCSLFHAHLSIICSKPPSFSQLAVPYPQGHCTCCSPVSDDHDNPPHLFYYWWTIILSLRLRSNTILSHCMYVQIYVHQLGKNFTTQELWVEFIQCLPEDYSLETASQIVLRMCSEEVGGEVSTCVILAKG